MNIIHIVSNKVWGGGERYVLDLCQALRADGHTPLVISRNYQPVTELFRNAGFLAAIMPMRGVAGIFAPVNIASFVNKLEGDTLIHVHNFKDAEIALQARKLAKNPEKIKVVATRHLVKPAGTSSSKTKTYSGLDAIIFVSKLALDEFLSSNPTVDRSKLHVVHNSVAMEPLTTKKSVSRPVRLIFSGRIVPEKGLDTLLRALAELKDLDWRLAVCGTGRGPDVMPLVRSARSLEINDRIDWKGHIDNVADELREAHIAVMPSRWAEPFGLAAVEALSQRCALVATNNGAQAEFLTDGSTALLVRPDSPAELAAAIRKLIESPALTERLAEKGAEHFANNLSYSKFYDKTLRIINSLF